MAALRYFCRREVVGGVSKLLTQKTPLNGEPVEYIEYTGLVMYSFELPTSIEVVF